MHYIYIYIIFINSYLHLQYILNLYLHLHYILNLHLHLHYITFTLHLHYIYITFTLHFHLHLYYFFMYLFTKRNLAQYPHRSALQAPYFACAEIWSIAMFLTYQRASRPYKRLVFDDFTFFNFYMFLTFFIFGGRRHKAKPLNKYVQVHVQSFRLV